MRLNALCRCERAEAHTDSAGTQVADNLIAPGSNCWRQDMASKASVIVDAEDYFRHARQAMLGARHQIMLIGWDFDTRIELCGECEDDAPRHLGPFLSWLAKRRPELNIHILKWNLGAIKLLGRGSTLFRVARWMAQDRIEFRLDAQHPVGASHHQKIIVIDDSFAFCGGIDMTGSRWDTRQHRDHDPRRKRPTTRRIYGPWHDASMAVEGPVAKALGEHARMRWKDACGETIDPPPTDGEGEIWPEALPVMFRDHPVAIARTRGACPNIREVREIEHLFVDMIGAAKRHIYAESQYFASRAIAHAMAKRLEEADGPEIVIVNPHAADGWLEESVMGSARAVLFDMLKAADRHGRFRIYTPATAGGEDIYVHAKVMIVDDRMLRVGSANFNNRSMGLDSECDLLIDAASDDDRATITALRADLLAEHLGVAPDAVADAVARDGSLIAAVEALRGEGRTLRPFTPPEFTELELEIARKQLLDPESGEGGFEPSARPGLLARFRHKRARPHAERHTPKMAEQAAI